MAKYPIKREFFPFSRFAPPVKSVEQAGKMGGYLKEPKWLKKTKGLTVKTEVIGGYRGEPIEVLILEPESERKNSPCLLYFHGGGFVFPAAWYHYRLAVRYAMEARCKVFFVQYRLIPNYSHPIPVEDCYESLLWVLHHAEELRVNPDRIAVGGDSAGGSLAAAVSQMARDRLGKILCGQMLVYPVTGCGLETESNRKFTDTPMWNSTLSRMIMNQDYLSENKVEKPAYASPIKAESFADLPQAYIETAEFDCLHDDGVLYAEKLRQAGISVELRETEGTMHGFDIALKAPTTKEMVGKRIAFLNRIFA